MMPPDPFLALAALPVGAVAGSYVSTAVLRGVEGRESVWSPSRCDHCGVLLGFARTIPLVSFALVRGACSACGGPIARTHLAGEAVGGLVVAIPFLVLEPTRAALLGALGLVLLASSLWDLASRRLPDALTIAAAVLGAMVAGSDGRLLEGLGAALVTMGILEATRRLAARRLGRPAMGLGDVKLAGALALGLGVAASWAIAAASMTGLAAIAALRPHDGRIPFGPHLAASSWAALLVMGAMS